MYLRPMGLIVSLGIAVVLIQTSRPAIVAQSVALTSSGALEVRTVQTVSAPSAYDQTVLSDGPVAFWGMTRSATTEQDLTGNGNTGTYAGGLPQSATMPNGDPAAHFNGSTQYLSVPSNPAFSISTSGYLTLETWLSPAVLEFPNHLDGYVNALGKCEEYSPTCEWAIRFYNANTERCNRVSAYAFNPSAGKGAGAFWQPSSCALFQPGEWLHIVAEYTVIGQPENCPANPLYPGTIDIWVNGIKWNPVRHRPTGCMSQEGYETRPEAKNSPVNIGTVQKDSWFKGAIGKVAIYDYFLTESQIKAHYQSMMTGRQAAGSCDDTCSLGIVYSRTGNIKTVLDDVPYIQANSNLYRIPTESNLNTWGQVLGSMYGGNLPTAADLVSRIAPSYRIVEFVDTSNGPRLYYLLIEADMAAGGIDPIVDTGWGVYLFDPSPVRQVVLEAPHPKADLFTEEEAIEGLLLIRPRALLLFTTHRCASTTEFSVMTGSTDACTGLPRYRMSDASHAASSSVPRVTNPFQVAHEELVMRHPATIAVQLHGSGASTTCPKIFLSNATTNGSVDPNGNVRRLQRRLTTYFPPVDVRVHDGTDACDLRATNNLQGRFSNGSSNPVSFPVDNAPGVETFIHMEQMRTVRETAGNRLFVLKAIMEMLARRGQLTSQ